MPATERFQRMLTPVHDRALQFARGLCRSVADGDDLFQEAALRAYKKLDQLRDDGAFRTWLFRILITLHRKRSRRAFWQRFLPLGTHLIAAAIARRVFARVAVEDRDRAEALPTRVDRAAVWLGIAGPFVLLMVLGVSFVTLGYVQIGMFACSLGDCGIGFDPAIYNDRVLDLGIVVSVALVATIAITRWRHPRVLASGAAALAGLALFGITIATGDVRWRAVADRRAGDAGHPGW